MIILLKKIGAKTECTINGFTTEHKTTFLNKLSFKDALNYLESRSKQVMKQFIIIVNQTQISLTKAILEENKINYREAGYPDGKVVVKESYPSKMNKHTDMRNFAKEEGYVSVTDAIGAMGSALVFKRKFNQYLEKLEEI